MKPFFIHNGFKKVFFSVFSRAKGIAAAFLWPLTSSLNEYTGMVGTLERVSAATYVDTDGVIQTADGDDTPFSHASVEDETGATEMRGSFVDGQAWFHDAGGLIAAYADTGNLLIIDDTAAKGYGFIGEVGTGETLAAALVEDDMADDSTGDWSVADCTVAFDTDHYEITRTAGTQSFYQDSLTFTDGALNKASFAIKDGTASGVVVNLAVGDTFYGGEVLDEAVTTTASWVTHTFYFTSTSGTDSLSFQSDFAANNYELKNFTISEVTEPAATAVKIYKEYTLATEGWNALDTGIDYNAAAWEFDVYVNLLFEYPNLVTNGDGSSATGWDSASGGVITSTGGKIRCVMPVGDGYGKVGQALTTIIGEQYDFQLDYFSGTMADGKMSYRAGTAVGGSDVVESTQLAGDGTINSKVTTGLTFTALSTTTYFYFAPRGDSTAGNYFEVDNFQIAQTASGAEPRFETNGLLSEGEGTNYCLHSNDMTDAAWTATNITPLKNVVGVDGNADSASRLTATAANGTILQSINTLASATHIYSVWMKRITGTGNIDLTDDNGANWTTKTLTSAWTRFSVSRSQTDPIVGIRMVADTDVIGVQYNQVEASQAYLTSAIPTTAIPVTRTADSHSWAMSTAFKNLMGNVADSPFTMVCEGTPKFDYGDTAGDEAIISIKNGIGLFYTDENGNVISGDGTATSAVDNDYAANTTYIFALRVFLDTTMKFEVGEKHGGSWTWDATPAAYDGSFNPATNLVIGHLNEYPFNIKDITFYDEAKTQAWIERKH